jgi:L,D-peptidoglycan transpeptidase YkuD (ErfK/YbiS/YcfS/YnhG family)
MRNEARIKAVGRKSAKNMSSSPQLRAKSRDAGRASASGTSITCHIGKVLIVANSPRKDKDSPIF